jgi:hypothetical protein
MSDVLIAIAWLGVATLIAGMCRVAARADAVEFARLVASARALGMEPDEARRRAVRAASQPSGSLAWAQPQDCCPSSELARAGGRAILTVPGLGSR